MSPEKDVERMQKACDMASNRDVNDEEIHYTRHHPRWWEAWTTPAAFLILLGGITWGVQLNFAVLNNSGSVAENKALIEKVVTLQQENARAIAEITVLQRENRRDIERGERDRYYTPPYSLKQQDKDNF